VQRKAEASDTVSRIESDVRNAWLDLQAAASQVEGRAAESRSDPGQSPADATNATRPESPTTSRWCRSQDAVAAAELDYISSVFAHNVAKLSLARALAGRRMKWSAS